MSASIAMTDQSFGSGLTRETLRRARWADVRECKGLRFAQIIHDLVKYDIRPEVRLNPAVLAAFRPGAEALNPQLGEAWDYVLTTEWQPVRADFASDLYYRAMEDATLGGPAVAMEVLDDGLGGKMWNPRATGGFPGLIEFRMPAEVPKIVSTVAVDPKEK